MSTPATRRASARRSYSTGDEQIDAQLRALVAQCGTVDSDLLFEMFASVFRLGRDPVSRLERKIINSALKEMRYAFRVFAPYRSVRKVSVFGSARVLRNSPAYGAAREFAANIAEEGWMVITGAGPGVMEAGNEGAGLEQSFGVNILLPFEIRPNPVIAGDPKLINFKYFFTRKLMFMKESDAFVLLPGGFGTLDEAFELLTLVQTGKSDLHPIVMLDSPGGTYWRTFDTYVREQILAHGYIDEIDAKLYRITDAPAEAVTEIQSFYRVYHSQRYVGSRLVLRLTSMPGEKLLDALSAEFADIVDGKIEAVDASPAEIRDEDEPDRPRIAFEFDRMHVGRLRILIDRLNESVPLGDTSPGAGSSSR